MPTPKENVVASLTREQFERLRRARKRIADTLPLCDDAEACGVQVAGQRAALEAMEKQLAEIEQRFFPNANALE